ncbi:bifunctional Aldolase-type TIM barrel/IMP dehydrogenase-GMP reductase [Babesia duncani]|uniref:GMP reductase n=1 Tax=Babesia duncani TaxID=323732 RepID=A0AAD9PMF2_9APIC|nr:bifunctional Aldolase-type TIM barrel/IMP dehydrogenase-GMP reductase [Babesia duncani]
MEFFDFNDVVLVPEKCILKTRADANVEARLGNRTFKIPLVIANMPAVLNEETAIELAKKGYFYIMHRFGNFDNVAFAKKMHEMGLYASISFGIGQRFIEEVNKLNELNIIPEYINVEIAHGHADSVREMIAHIRNRLGDGVFIIAGNVATPEGLVALEDWGADAVRVGIGPGFACTTTYKTGFGTRGWHLSAVAKCAKAKRKVLIADGGLKYSGDIAKAIHFGADWVMSGYLVADCKDHDGEQYNGQRTYYGNASFQNTRTKSRVEGRSVQVPISEDTVMDRLREIQEDLESSVSYAGGTKLEHVKKVKHVFLRT